MTQENKQLLLKDLCARLPYGVKVAFQIGENEPDVRTFTGEDYDYLRMYHYVDEFTNCTFKPYLRPMSDMTAKEKKKYYHLCDNYYDIHFNSIESIDYLNSIHVDYRGLIGKGLAIKVTKENNPYA